MKTYAHLRQCIAEFLKREIFQAKVIEKIKTRILCSITFFPENHTVYDIVWKNMVETETPHVTI